VLTANVGLPHRSIREAIALAIHLVVHIARVEAGDALRNFFQCVDSMDG
jgi:hypothetical protein